jgi:glucan phosphoethanolaminetransferase (alkaline phosphatase superfamily)
MLTVLFWKKAWIWFKHYWYWPVIVLLLLFSLATGASMKNKLFGLLFRQREQYEKELEVITSVNEEKDLKKEKVVEAHKEELEKIEKEHDVKIEDLKKEKHAELVAIIEENKDSPDKLAEEIAKILSAKFHKKSE